MLTLRLSLRPNLSAQTVRRIESEAAIIADGIDFLTPHQVQHLRPPLVAMLARAAARRPAAEMVVSTGF